MLGKKHITLNRKTDKQRNFDSKDWLFYPGTLQRFTSFVINLFTHAWALTKNIHCLHISSGQFKHIQYLCLCDSEYMIYMCGCVLNSVWKVTSCADGALEILFSPTTGCVFCIPLSSLKKKKPKCKWESIVTSLFKPSVEIHLGPFRHQHSVIFIIVLDISVSKKKKCTTILMHTIDASGNKHVLKYDLHLWNWNVMWCIFLLLFFISPV